MSRYARFAHMRRLLAAVSATVVVVALTPAPAWAAGLLVHDVTVSPTLGGAQTIDVTGTSGPVFIDSAGPIYIGGTRGEPGFPSKICSSGPPIRCDGNGSSSSRISMTHKSTSPPLSLHGTSWTIHAYAEDPPGTRVAEDTGTLTIRFQADLAITSASLNAATKQFTTAWTSNGPDPVVRLSASNRVAGAVVRVQGLPAGWTGPVECTNQGGVAVCIEPRPTSLTFNFSGCGTFGPVTASVDADSDDLTGSNDSRTAAAASSPCPTTPRPPGGGGGGGGGGGASTPASATPSGSATVDTSGTPTPRLTVVAGAGATRPPLDAPDSRVRWAIIVALAALLLAIALVAGWWIYQRRQRHPDLEEPWFSS